ncbi:uncharacterized protein RCC_07200 [Ramularia collo-cygni]|uniref:Uncharacterized protein n=1 Tax=Ramularia collo-cygni TaxID=112498 RepID=A0A2D3V992_9PEZI|nr:uncharacterized protein RCC_07200 [Ramularia collo-cygni]CZT21337.1 uncharacterized protein RCC_07200 [Ramularia collo-cygni]
MSSATTPNDPDRLIHLGQADIASQQLDEQNTGRTPSSQGVLPFSKVETISSASTANKPDSAYYATSVGDKINPGFSRVDTKSNFNDRSEAEVTTLPEGHGVLCGWGTADSFGGFNSVW